MTRRIVATLLVAVACSLVQPGAAAQNSTSLAEEVAAALATEPLYVHPQAEDLLSEDDAEDVREEISEADAGAIYIAVLPENAEAQTGGSLDALLRMIGERLDRTGTYILVAGDELRAGTTGGTPFASGEVPAIASDAIEEERGEGTEAVLVYMLDRLEESAQDGGSATDSGAEGSGIGWFPIVLVLGGGWLLFNSVRRRRERQRREREELEEVRQVALDDLVALGDDLRALDLDVEMPGANPAAKKHYVRALECYEAATTNLDQARRPQDLQRVTSTLEEGRYEMAAARAALEGRPAPERRAPCFFDPRHGPSVRDVEWAPPDGMPRKVPACAADAGRVEAGEEPDAREVMVGGERTPYWNAPSYYGPWAGGYFGGFGGFGLFEGLLLGHILGGMFGGGWGHYGDAAGHDGGSSEGDFGGGDFGGGGFGGGDFGGGDFGGGDFG